MGRKGGSVEMYRERLLKIQREIEGRTERLRGGQDNREPAVPPENGEPVKI